MSSSYQQLFEGNKNWRTRKAKDGSSFFKDIAAGQKPEFMFIGCADSRVHVNEITGKEAGNFFVHRNVANLVVQNDVNLLSALYYAVAALKVKHVIVCGHESCGGVTAAYKNKDAGIVNHWIQPIKDVQEKYTDELEAIEDENERINKLIEYNAIEQVHNLSKIGFVQEALKNKSLSLHGWMFQLGDGTIKELDCTVTSNEEVRAINRW